MEQMCCMIIDCRYVFFFFFLFDISSTSVAEWRARLFYMVFRRISRIEFIISQKNPTQAGMAAKMSNKTMRVPIYHDNIPLKTLPPCCESAQNRFLNSSLVKFLQTNEWL